MSPPSRRLRFLFAAVAGTLALAAPTSLAGAVEAGVYKMHRPGFRVRLEVRGDAISPTDVWFLQRCSDGSKGSASLHLHGRGQRIRIDSDGRFQFRLTVGAGYWRRLRLTGRVQGHAIVGTFTAWERRAATGPVCGSGRPGNRSQQFTA